MKILPGIVVVLGAALLHAEAPSGIALRNARIVTVSGPIIAKGTVLLRDGMIAAVGENVTVPPDAWVIEAQGLTVYPGLIDALSTWGISAPSSETTATTSTRTAAPVTRGRRSGGGLEPVAHGPEERPS